MKNSGKTNPEEIRDVGERDPLYARIDGDHRPDERAEYEQDIDRGEDVVLKTELEPSEGEVEDEIESERQSDHPRHLPLESLIEDGAEGGGDDRVEYRPHRAKEPRRWRPLGLE